MKKFCPQCGSKIEKNDVYCQICGHKLETESQPKESKKTQKEEKIDWNNMIKDPIFIGGLALLTLFVIAVAAFFIFFAGEPSKSESVCGDGICADDEFVHDCPEDCEIVVKKDLQEPCSKDEECKSGNCCYNICVSELVDC